MLQNLRQDGHRLPYPNLLMNIIAFDLINVVKKVFKYIHKNEKSDFTVELHAAEQRHLITVR